MALSVEPPAEEPPAGTGPTSEAAPPQITGLRAGALPDGVEAFGWKPCPTRSGDENGMDLALLLSRSSHCRSGCMGCAIVSSHGEVLACHINGPFWDPINREHPSSDTHAEVNAIGLCARRGIACEGASAYITMPPCRRCFQVLASSGIKRIVSRKQFNSQDGDIFERTARQQGIALVIVADTEERKAAIAELVGASTGKRKREEDQQELQAESAG
eukprot:gnl/TRDRNA2_/TRDRNA2_167037_c0_seq2.p1 gnl/TRDRNA2_/TRDRNA2_167037_c0~~gnl/TRDRNA2_/TRDRNA2_167037_c0_seq2.p1  ORF type:complete len:216 (-),score=30.72 gnl/TRDRNA2_/TRDRNA2_167037_c0_seq2:20-667(-)